MVFLHGLLFILIYLMELALDFKLMAHGFCKRVKLHLLNSNHFGFKKCATPVGWTLCFPSLEHRRWLGPCSLPFSKRFSLSLRTSLKVVTSILRLFFWSNGGNSCWLTLFDALLKVEVMITTEFVVFLTRCIICAFSTQVLRMSKAYPDRYSRPIVLARRWQG